MATVTLVNPMPPFDPDSDIGANIGPKWKSLLQVCNKLSTSLEQAVRTPNLISAC